MILNAVFGESGMFYICLDCGGSARGQRGRDLLLLQGCLDGRKPFSGREVFSIFIPLLIRIMFY